MTRAYFADRAAALAYLETLDGEFAWSPPEDGWPRQYAGHPTVFTASCAPRTQWERWERSDPVL